MILMMKMMLDDDDEQWTDVKKQSLSPYTNMRPGKAIRARNVEEKVPAGPVPAPLH
jgi:hypothetical protein